MLCQSLCYNEDVFNVPFVVNRYFRYVLSEIKNERNANLILTQLFRWKKKEQKKKDRIWILLLAE